MVFKAVKGLLLNKPVPVAVSFVITNRCNYNCSYCDRWQLHTQELSTDQALDMIRGLRSMGMRFLQITGGEPFLRKDLGSICKTAHSLGVYVGINSNGSLLERNTQVLDFINKITFSLDGPKHVHEIARPKGSFDEVIHAIELVKGLGNTKIGLTTTITRENWEYVNFMIDLAYKYNVTVSFQPAFENTLSGNRDNPLSPEPWMLQKALAVIRKSTHRQVVTNGPVDLALMSYWPDDQGLNCAGGHIFFRIESNSDVLICGIKDKPGGRHPNILRDGLVNALAAVGRPACGRCYNHTRLKINALYSVTRGNLQVAGKIMQAWRNHEDIE